MNPVTQVVNMVQFNKKVVCAAVVARVIELESKSTFKTYISPEKTETRIYALSSRNLYPKKLRMN